MTSTLMCFLILLYNRLHGVTERTNSKRMVVLKNTMYVCSEAQASENEAHTETFLPTERPCALFLGSKIEWMFGKTPPLAIVTLPSNLLSSSSLRTASCTCLGTMRDFLLSLDAFPANSRTCKIILSASDRKFLHIKKRKNKKSHSVILWERRTPKLHPPERTRMQNPQT